MQYNIDDLADVAVFGILICDQSTYVDQRTTALTDNFSYVWIILLLGICLVGSML